MGPDGSDPKLRVNGIWVLDYITELAASQNPGAGATEGEHGLV